MVRNAARSEQARRAAALTPSTPQSFAPQRRRSASGLFNVDAIITRIDGERLQSAVSSPTPSLILPITGPGVPGGSRTASASYPPLPPIPIVPQRKSSAKPPKPTTWERVSDAASMLGFAAAWVATTGLGAVVVATLMTREHAPAPPALASLSAPPSAGEPAEGQCPKTWEPPLYAVNDLPVAPEARHAALVPVWAPTHYVPPPVAPTPAVTVAAPRRFEGAQIASTRKTESTPAVSLRSSRAKSAPAQPAGPPHSLEDWIRRAVTTDGKTPHSS